MSPPIPKKIKPPWLGSGFRAPARLYGAVSRPAVSGQAPPCAAWTGTGSHSRNFAFIALRMHRSEQV